MGAGLQQRIDLRRRDVAPGRLARAGVTLDKRQARVGVGVDQFLLVGGAHHPEQVGQRLEGFTDAYDRKRCANRAMWRWCAWVVAMRVIERSSFQG